LFLDKEDQLHQLNKNRLLRKILTNYMTGSIYRNLANGKKAIFMLAILLICNTVYSQTLTVKGRVADADGNAIAGATIQPLNQAYGVATDADGNFSIEVRSKNQPLIIRAVGYATAQIVPAGDGEVSISLKETVVQLPDLVVTAEKEEGNLINVPYSVSSIESSKVEQYRIWNLKELSTIVPNLYSANPGDNRNVTSIRGIATTSYDPAVATYIDGVNQFSLDTYIAPLFDVERIEILRGPQSTLYGRNAMGGVINIITKAPGNTLTGFGEISAGSFGQQRYSLGIRTPLIKDRLFFGAAGMYEKSDGFYTNLFDNSDFDKRHSTTGNYYLNYVASQRLNLSLNFKHHANRNNGSFPLEYMETALANPYTVNQNAVGQLIDNTINTSLKAIYKTPSLQFMSLTSYQSNHRYYDKPLDGDFSPIDGVTIINDYGKKWNFVEVFTEEIKVSSFASDDSKLSWTAGTYMFIQKNPVKQAVRFGEDAAYLGIDDSNFSIINSTDGLNKGIAFYGQATLRPVSNLSFTLGLRYDYERKEQSVKGEYQHDPDPEPVFDIQPDTTATASFNAISPKASVQYNFNESSSIYASYSRGFRTGGLTQLGSDPSQPPLYPYDPEFSNNFEVGSKHLLFDNRLQLNLSAFFVQVKDAQVPTLILPDAFVVTRNTGELQATGVEAEISATPVRGLNLEFNLGFTNSEYQQLDVAQGGNEVDLQGNKQIFTPESTARFAVQYTLKPVGSMFHAFVRGEWSYAGTIYFDLANTISQSAYSLLHARAGVGYKRFELSGWARNIGDEDYIAYAYDFGAVHFGEPRNVGASLKVSF
jgi:iron complex outermembrane recepter protein